MTAPKQMTDALPPGATPVDHKTGATWNDGGAWHLLVARLADGSYVSVRMESDYAPDLLVCEPVEQWPPKGTTYTAEQVAAAVKAALEGAADKADDELQTARRLGPMHVPILASVRNAIRALAADPQAVARFVEAGKT